MGPRRRRVRGGDADLEQPRPPVGLRLRLPRHRRSGSPGRRGHDGRLVGLTSWVRRPRHHPRPISSTTSSGQPRSAGRRREPLAGGEAARPSTMVSKPSPGRRHGGIATCTAPTIQPLGRGKASMSERPPSSTFEAPWSRQPRRDDQLRVDAGSPSDPETPVSVTTSGSAGEAPSPAGAARTRARASRRGNVTTAGPPRRGGRHRLVQPPFHEHVDRAAARQPDVQACSSLMP